MTLPPLPLYEEFSRDGWAQLRDSTPIPLHEQDLQNLRSLGDTLPTDEVETIYLPLTRLIGLHAPAATRSRQTTAAFLGRDTTPAPYVLGIAGSVGVGKSTTARVLRALLAGLPSRPTVDLVTTDGFLYPNTELQRRGLMNRKGFPESYDLPALIRFLTRMRLGEQIVEVPIYSHLTYDVVTSASQIVEAPDILIIEGLNVLQHKTTGRTGASPVLVSDFLDFTIYLDADEADIRRWYIERFLILTKTAFQLPESYFHEYAALSREEGRKDLHTDMERDQSSQLAAKHYANPGTGPTYSSQRANTPHPANPIAPLLSDPPVVTPPA